MGLRCTGTCPAHTLYRQRMRIKPRTCARLLEANIRWESPPHRRNFQLVVTRGNPNLLDGVLPEMNATLAFAFDDLALASFDHCPE